MEEGKREYRMLKRRKLQPKSRSFNILKVTLHIKELEKEEQTKTKLKIQFHTELHSCISRAHMASGYCVGQQCTGQWHLRLNHNSVTIRSRTDNKVKPNFVLF